ATANTYIESRDYYRNSARIVLKASRYLQDLKAFRPDIYPACEQAMQVQNDDMDFVRVDKAAFQHCPDESSDDA
ncbi:mannose-1-phosphate guanylyltransferase/mannose-6-phosphate isomerase, partial [Pseudoalteromonas sp. S409]